MVRSGEEPRVDCPAEGHARLYVREELANGLLRCSQKSAKEAGYLVERRGEGCGCRHGVAIEVREAQGSSVLVRKNGLYSGEVDWKRCSFGDLVQRQRVSRVYTDRSACAYEKCIYGVTILQMAKTVDPSGRMMSPSKRAQCCVPWQVELVSSTNFP